MKLNVAANPVTRIGMGREVEYTINNSPEAFRILSSGIYKDKVGAVVREISTNAYDAHVLVGREDRPFDVHLPVEIAPYFSVRDYGPGLSEPNMMELYSTYFLSDKNQSDALVGGKGLGSKSPFSYTKSFTVVSRFEGVKGTYDCFLNEKRMPAIVLRHSEPSDEESGLEVIVPVNRQTDFREFLARARRSYSYFPVVPNVTSHPDFTVVKKREPLIEGPDFTVYVASNNHYEQTGAQVIMGVVAYPVTAAGVLGLSDEDDEELDYLPPHIRQMVKQQGGLHSSIALWHHAGYRTSPRRDPGQLATAEDKINSLCGMPIEIRMPIGSLDMTAGREDLSYDDETIALLKTKLLEIEESIREFVQAKFVDCKTVLEARLMWGKLVTDPVISSMMKDIGEIKVKGVVIDSEMMSFDYDKMPGTTVYRYDAESTENEVPRKQEWADLSDSDIHHHYHRRNYGNRLSLEPTYDGKLFFLDVKEGHKQRVKQFRDSSARDQDGHKSAFDVLTGHRVIGSGEPVGVIVIDVPKEAYQMVRDQLDGIEIGLISSLPLDVNYVGKTRAQIMCLKSEDVEMGAPVPTTYYGEAWRNKNVVIEDGGIYVLTGHCKVFLGETENQLGFSDVYNAARYLGMMGSEGDPDLFAIPKTESSRIVRDGKWVTFWDHIRPRLAAHIKSNDKVEAKTVMAGSRAAFQLKHSQVGTVRCAAWLKEVSSVLPPEHALARFVASHDEHAAVGVVYDHLQRSTEVLGIALDAETVKKYDLNTAWEDILKTYPLISYVLNEDGGTTISDVEMAPVRHYINAVDAYQPESAA